MPDEAHVAHWHVGTRDACVRDLLMKPVSKLQDDGVDASGEQRMPNDVEDEICALLDAMHLTERDKREPLEEIEDPGDSGSGSSFMERHA
jgi:hypothetical protein